MEIAMTTIDDKRAVDMLAALSQPTRLRIIQCVAAHGEEGVPAGAIARAVQCPASTLSFHLKELSQAGLLTPHPKGRFIRYSVVADSFVQLGGFVLGIVGHEGSRGAPGKPRTAKRGQARRKGKAGADAGQARNQLSIFED
jgi:ArsR family transcriptional regulator